MAKFADYQEEDMKEYNNSRGGVLPARSGVVYLVGAGPGDPGLITLKGSQVLGKADVVYYDYLANPELLKHARKNARCVDVGKRHKGLRVSQIDIEQFLINDAKKGQTVVRLKGGDPFIFGRGGEEALALKEAGIAFEVIPGISSFNAVPAYAGIPLTHRNLAADIALVTGHEDPEKSQRVDVPHVNWQAAAQMGTVVILMAMGNLRSNLGQLIQFGKSPDTPAAIISRGTYPHQKIIKGTLSTLADLSEKASIKAPSLVVVGDVVSLNEKLDWYSSKSLFNKRIVVTRSQNQASELSALLQEEGAEVIELPTIEIKPLSSYKIFDARLKKISGYQWLLFTSVNAVEIFWQRWLRLKKDVRSLAHLKIAAVGGATKDALLAKGLWVDLMPKDFRSEGLVKEFKRLKIKGHKIFFPRAREGREVLTNGLKELGARVDLVEAYRTTLPRISNTSEIALSESDWISGSAASEIALSESDWITFASSSTVENFFKMFGESRGKELLHDVKIACLGPITRNTIEAFGLTVAVMPKQARIKDLVKGISDAQ